MLLGANQRLLSTGRIWNDADVRTGGEIPTAGVSGRQVAIATTGVAFGAALSATVPGIAKHSVVAAALGLAVYGLLLLIPVILIAANFGAQSNLWRDTQHRGR